MDRVFWLPAMYRYTIGVLHAVLVHYLLLWSGLHSDRGGPRPAATVRRASALAQPVGPATNFCAAQLFSLVCDENVVIPGLCRRATVSSNRQSNLYLLSRVPIYYWSPTTSTISRSVMCSISRLQASSLRRPGLLFISVAHTNTELWNSSPPAVPHGLRNIYAILESLCNQRASWPAATNVPAVVQDPVIATNSRFGFGPRQFTENVP